MNPIKFSWTKPIDNNGYGSGAEQYIIQVSEYANFRSIEWDAYTKDLSIIHSFTKSDDYYWRVAARDKAGNPKSWDDANWSEYYSFSLIVDIVADFTVENNIVAINTPIQFNDRSTGSPTAWNWDFDNDGTVDDHQKNPVHIYDTKGKKDVSLEIEFGNTTDKCVKTNFITVLEPIELKLEDIGNKNVSVGQSLTFKVNASGPKPKDIQYSASNLPLGATFNSQSHVFNWLPKHSDVGSYEGVHFEVNDGTNTDTEDITITVEEDAKYISISGVVRDRESNLPIENAHIMIIGNQNTYDLFTEPNGEYKITDIVAGNYHIQVIADGYRSSSRNVGFDSDGDYLVNFELVSEASNYIKLSETMRIYSNDIDESESNIFKLAGNVNINDILYFDGTVEVDKRANLYNPVISGSGRFYAADIQGEDKEIYPGNLPFKFEVIDNSLLSKGMAYFYEIPLILSGFPLTLVAMSISDEDDDLYLHVLPKFPFPLDKIVDHYSQSSVPTVIENVCIDVIYSHSNGTNYSGSIEDLGYNFGAFQISGVHVEFDTEIDLFGGGFDLQIPGAPLNQGKSEDHLGDEEYEDFMSTPIQVVDSVNTVISEMNVAQLAEFQKSLGTKFFKIGMDIEFLSGKINKLIIRLGAPVPIAATGLFITEMTGGVSELQSDNWKLHAYVDIEPGLELPVIKLNDFGVEIAPFSYLKGRGSFEFFNHEISNGFVEYDDFKSSLAGAFTMNLADICTGRNEFSLRKGSFHGGGNVTLKTPATLPWWLKWAENQVLSSAEASIDNQYIRTQARFLGLSLASKLEFGNPNRPYFHFYLGANFETMKKIWKGTKGEKQVYEFQVPENSSQIFIVAGNDANLFDFVAIDPNVKIFNDQNTIYHEFENSLQTVMIINAPASGNWEFQTSQTGDIDVDFRFCNQAPTVYIANPDIKKSKSNKVALSFTDYSDTLDVKIFYDTDRKNFDGIFIKQFELINNANIDFEWQNEDLQNGEYYIYCTIDDGHNAPIIQYSPGSILVQNADNIEVPDGFSAWQSEDSLLVKWDASQNTDHFGTAVYCRNISDGFCESHTVVVKNNTYFTKLIYGQEYEIWCRFIDSNQKLGPISSVLNVVYKSNGKNNNKPYFTLDPDSSWFFIVGEKKELELKANDIDNNHLNYTLTGGPGNMTVEDSYLSWMPTHDQRGTYSILLTVTDGIDTDSIYKEIAVYTQEQVSVSVAFSSVNLYEKDNMFISISNLRSLAQFQDVAIYNLNTGTQTKVICRKVDKFNFIGQFSVSSTAKSVLPVSNGDSLRVLYSFEGNDFEAFAVYDSEEQISDTIEPDEINDLAGSIQSMNQILLRWTAPGDDGNSGEALIYDIRYDFKPIDSAENFLIANKIANSIYPSPAGFTDSIIINLAVIDKAFENDRIYFSVIAEDEMMNRSAISNTCGVSYLYLAEEIIANLIDIEDVDFKWDAQSKKSGSKDSTVFYGYELFRKFENQGYQLLLDNLGASNYKDNLHDKPDGDYKYAVIACFSSGQTDSIFSGIVHLDRFENIRLLCTLCDTTAYDSIYLKIIGQDALYHMNYEYCTDITGLLLIDDVFQSDYELTISKEGYQEINSSITINQDSTEFSFALDTIPDINYPPQFISTPFSPDTVIAINTPSATENHYKFRYLAEDLNSSDILKYCIINCPYGACIDSVTGDFLWGYSINNCGCDTIIVGVTDGSNPNVCDTTILHIYRYGDVTLEGTVSGLDASLILKYSNGSISFSKIQSLLGDVSGNGNVMSYDASFVLQFDAELRDRFPVEELAPTKPIIAEGALEWTSKSVGNSLSNFTIPITLTETAANVYSVDLKIYYDPQTVKIGPLFDKLPDTWQMLSSLDHGVLSIALAGAVPFNIHEIAILAIEVLDASMDVTISGESIFNDNRVQIMDEIIIKSIPSEYSLHQNHPNPFNPNTCISYEIPVASDVKIEIFDISGRSVQIIIDEYQNAGIYSSIWDASHCVAGIYFYRFTAGKFTEVKKCALLK